MTLTTNDIDKFTNEMNKYISKNASVEIQSLYDYEDVSHWIDTGSFALNWIISNDFFAGIPGGRVVVVSGESGKGKSLLGDNFLGNNVREDGISIKFDIEDSGTHAFTAQIVGSEEVARAIQVVRPQNDEIITIEKVMNFIEKLLDYQSSKGENKSKSVVLMIDSISNLPAKHEIEQLKLPEEKRKRDMSYATAIRQMFRTLLQRFKKENLTIIGIGQKTANIAMSGFTPPGHKQTKTNLRGSAFEYYNSLEIEMKNDKELVDPETKTPYGIKMLMQTEKNRIKYKGRNAWLYFNFNGGVQRYGGLCELLAKYKVFKPSAQGSYYSEYAPTTIFEWQDKTKTEEEYLEIKDTKKFKSEKEKFEKNGWTGKEIKDEESGKDFIYFTRPYTLQFKAKDLKQIVEENGEWLLEKWNEELNNIYENIMSNEEVEDLEESEEE